MDRSVESKIMNILKLYCLSLVMVFASFGHAAQDQMVFARANQYCKDKDYQRACKAYDLIEDKGFAVLFNMALCYYYQQDFFHALLHAKRAEKQAGWYEFDQVQQLLDTIEEQVDSLDEQVSWQARVAVFGKKCILVLSMLMLQILWLFLLLIFLSMWYYDMQKTWTKSWITVCCMAIILCLALSYKKDMLTERLGIVKHQAYLLAGPDSSFSKKLVLQPLTMLKIIATQPESYQVQVGNELGWIQDVDIELV